MAGRHRFDLFLLSADCGSASGTGSASAASPAIASPTGPTVAPATGTAGTGSTAELGDLRKTVVIMEESHSIQQVFPAGMPYLWGLARWFGFMGDWSDVGHPSLPNYLAIFGGSAFNDPADCVPSPGCTHPGPTVFGQALSRGETAKVYEAVRW